MIAILVASNHKVLAPYTPYLAAISIVAYIALESPVSGMSANPARSARILRPLLASRLDLSGSSNFRSQQVVNRKRAWPLGRDYEERGEV